MTLHEFSLATPSCGTSYSLCNIGIQEKWTGKFANTRSIQQTAFRSWSSELDVIQTVRQLEERYSSYLKTRKEDPYWQEIKECTCINVYTQKKRGIMGIHDGRNYDASSTRTNTIANLGLGDSLYELQNHLSI